MSVATKSVSFIKLYLEISTKQYLKTIFFLLAAPIEIGCSSDDECAFTQACRNRACVNPCAVDNPCARTAECTANGHRAQCKCPPGYTGDPYSQCVPIFDGECRVDPDCPDNRACISNQCLDPCVEYDPCGKHALCETSSHFATCRCPTGWAGDPHTECFQCKFHSYKVRKKYLGY